MLTKPQDDNGYIVAETIGVFIPFVLLIISILSLVNIVAVQARMHYALTQTANTLSMYSYTLEVLGMVDDLQSIHANAANISEPANSIRDDINSIIDGLGSLSDIGGAIESGQHALGTAAEWGSAARDDPKAMFSMFLSYGASELMSAATEMLSRPLIGRYLSNGSDTGDAYLIRSGVVNKRTNQIGLNALEFHRWVNLGRGNSIILDKDGNVKLTVEYEILYTFAGLPLPFKPTLKVTQTVVTRAWLNGSGEGYK
ncbi:MAG: hypothetical protein FWH33_04160 [Oscillospiraceae bacterium]|nr:hypothetical protein [Oscillospiraceae bacterium]